MVTAGKGWSSSNDSALPVGKSRSGGTGAFRRRAVGCNYLSSVACLLRAQQSVSRCLKPSERLLTHTLLPRLEAV